MMIIITMAIITIMITLMLTTSIVMVKISQIIVTTPTLTTSIINIPYDNSILVILTILIVAITLLIQRPRNYKRLL